MWPKSLRDSEFFSSVFLVGVFFAMGSRLPDEQCDEEVNALV